MHVTCANHIIACANLALLKCLTTTVFFGKKYCLPRNKINTLFTGFAWSGWENFKILKHIILKQPLFARCIIKTIDSEKNAYILDIKEALYIKDRKPDINAQAHYYNTFPNLKIILPFITPCTCQSL